MTKTPKTAVAERAMLARFSTVTDSGPVTEAASVPWETGAPRGDLDLPKDGSQHRRYASLYEDLMN